MGNPAAGKHLSRHCLAPVWSASALPPNYLNQCEVCEAQGLSDASSVCRAGFVAVDVVLALLVAAFVISTLVAWLRSIFLRTFTKRKAALLLDCLTCAIMILSEPPVWTADFACKSAGRHALCCSRSSAQVHALASLQFPSITCTWQLLTAGSMRTPLLMTFTGQLPM